MTTVTPLFRLPSGSSADVRHPLGNKVKILFSSVFGPYAQDDEFGSRRINPMELYQNQVTREQGAFSLRMFHRSWGLMLIRANISAPSVLLDFPTLERFKQELADQRYDVIGIGAISPNLLKVKLMCELIRQHQPWAKIVVGGHIAAMAELPELIDADHIIRGDGIRWFRSYVGDDPQAPIRHPYIYSSTETRALGIKVGDGPQKTAAVVIPSVGCPLGCEFCSTSALFGGKGNFINFYETGDELFSVMDDISRTLKTDSFFVMDENFLLHRPRALRLLELMQENNRPWSLFVFSSASALKLYTMEELLGLGISWAWLGLEGENSHYAKLKNTDTFELVSRLRAHGIRVLGSTIIGLPNHSPENISGVIDYAVRHNTDFHQFMLYTPMPGTPLQQEHKTAGTLLSEEAMPPADTHGQLRFKHQHPLIKDGQETGFLKQAFLRDFETNGPSLIRMAETLLAGWVKLKNHPDLRIRERITRDAACLTLTWSAASWATVRWFRNRSPQVSARAQKLLTGIKREFGWKARLAAAFGGPFLLATIKRETRRLAQQISYEPRCFYETGPAQSAIPVEVAKAMVEAI